MIKSNVIRTTVLLLFTIFFLGGCNSSEVKKESQKISKTQNKEPKTEELENLEPIGNGKITTVADGLEMKQVNLWSSTSSKRRIVCSLTNAEKVSILEDADPYYLVQSMGDKSCKGYCMKGFIIKN